MWGKSHAVPPRVVQGTRTLRVPANSMNTWFLITDQGKNYLTFVDVTEDYTIIDLENQSKGGSLIVTELHGKCCSHPQPEEGRKCLKLEKPVGRAGRWGLEPPSLPQVPSLLISWFHCAFNPVGCSQESVHKRLWMGQLLLSHMQKRHLTTGH